MAPHQESLLGSHQAMGAAFEGASTLTAGGVGQPILIAEDDPALALALKAYLARFGFAVRTTESPQEASRWLEHEAGPLVLDGSVLKQMGIPLGELPGRVIIWSGDRDLVDEARHLGVKAFCKGSPEGFAGLLLWEVDAEG